MQDPQQPGLQRQIHLGDLVKEQRAAGGRLQEPNLAALFGAGEGALHIAEKLGFQHTGVEIGAVDGGEHGTAAGAGVVDGLGVELLAGAALAFQQDGGVGGGDLLGQALHLQRPGALGHHVGKGVAGAVGLVDAPQHLTAALLIGIQLRAEVIGLLDKGDHRQAAGQRTVLPDGVHIHKIDVPAFLPGSVENGPPGAQHLRQPGAGPQLPQEMPLHGPRIMAGLLGEKLPVSTVGENDAALSVDEGDALRHGVENGPRGVVQTHGSASFAAKIILC